MKTSKLTLSQLSVKSFRLQDQNSARILGGDLQHTDNDPGVTMIDRQSCANCTNISG
ncbi:MAG: hypothetical protein WBB45_16460 [Cyclobacteriaceae bacterium]